MGLPWQIIKGFHFDESRERFYFEGTRCFYWIDKEDLDEIFQREEVQVTNITMIPSKEEGDDIDDGGETDDDNTMKFIIAVVGVLIVILIIANLRMNKKGRSQDDEPDLMRRIQ